jgi:hypothetical protein
VEGILAAEAQGLVPKPGDDMVQLEIDGAVVSIPVRQLRETLKQQSSLPGHDISRHSPQKALRDVDQIEQAKKFDTLGQQAATVLEGGAHVVTAGGSSAILDALGAQSQQRAQFNPKIRLASEIGAGIGTIFTPSSIFKTGLGKAFGLAAPGATVGALGREVSKKASGSVIKALQKSGLSEKAAGRIGRVTGEAAGGATDVGMLSAGFSGNEHVDELLSDEGTLDSFASDVFSDTLKGTFFGGGGGLLGGVLGEGALLLGGKRIQLKKNAKQAVEDLAKAKEAYKVLSQEGDDAYNVLLRAKREQEASLRAVKKAQAEKAKLEDQLRAAGVSEEEIKAQVKARIKDIDARANKDLRGLLNELDDIERVAVSKAEQRAAKAKLDAMNKEARREFEEAFARQEALRIKHNREVAAANKAKTKAARDRWVARRAEIEEEALDAANDVKNARLRQRMFEKAARAEDGVDFKAIPGVTENMVSKKAKAKMKEVAKHLNRINKKMVFTEDALKDLAAGRVKGAKTPPELAQRLLRDLNAAKARARVYFDIPAVRGAKANWRNITRKAVEDETGFMKMVDELESAAEAGQQVFPWEKRRIVSREQATRDIAEVADVLRGVPSILRGEREGKLGPEPVELDEIIPRQKKGKFEPQRHKSDEDLLSPELTKKEREAMNARMDKVYEKVDKLLARQKAAIEKEVAKEAKFDQARIRLEKAVKEARATGGDVAELEAKLASTRASLQEAKANVAMLKKAGKHLAKDRLDLIEPAALAALGVEAATGADVPGAGVLASIAGARRGAQIAGIAARGLGFHRAGHALHALSVAGLVSGMGEAIALAAEKSLSITGKVARTAPRVGTILSYSGTNDPQKAFEERMEMLDEVGNGNTQVLGGALEQVTDVDGRLTEPVMSRNLRTIQYQIEQAPRDPGADGFGVKRWMPTAQELRSYSNKVFASENPLKVVDMWSKGAAVKDHIDALEATSPGLFAKLQAKVMEIYADKTADGKRLSSRQLSNMSMVLGGNPDQTMNNMNTFLSQLPGQGQQQKQAQPQAGAKAVTAPLPTTGQRMSNKE